MYPGIHAQQRPDQPALIMSGSGEVITYAELDRRSNRLAHFWREQGLQRGDHVASFVENHPRYAEVAWAALRSGLYLTPMNSFLAADEIAFIIENSGAESLITSAAKTKVVDELVTKHDLSRVKTKLMIGGASSGCDDYETTLAAYPDTPIADESHGRPMMYSSGTTGRPKGVLRALPTVRMDEVDPVTVRTTKAMALGPESMVLIPAPMYHAAPFLLISLVHRAGGTVILMEKFDAEAALQAIERHGVTDSQWVPTMFVRFLKLPVEVRTRYDLSTHRYASHGAAPCPPNVKQAMIEWWGPILHEYYAGSEGLGATAIDSETWLKKPGSVGQVTLGKLHIVDAEGHEVPTGEQGTIYFSDGPPFEYWNDESKTAESRMGTWATLGDIGYVDGDGFLFLTDRKANMIISGGVNIYPREAEDILIGHPSVADVAVFGVPNEDLGEEVKAVIELVDGVEPSVELEHELIAFARQHLAHFKAPRTIDFEDELPRLPTGKLYKRLLRDRYWPEAADGNSFLAAAPVLTD